MESLPADHYELIYRNRSDFFQGHGDDLPWHENALNDNNNMVGRYMAEQQDVISYLNACYIELNESNKTEMTAINDKEIEDKYKSSTK